MESDITDFIHFFSLGGVEGLVERRRLSPEVDEHQDELLVALAQQVLGRHVQQVAADLLERDDHCSRALLTSSAIKIVKQCYTRLNSIYTKGKNY